MLIRETNVTNLSIFNDEIFQRWYRFINLDRIFCNLFLLVKWILPSKHLMGPSSDWIGSGQALGQNDQADEWISIKTTLSVWNDAKKAALTQGLEVSGTALKKRWREMILRLPIRIWLYLADQSKLHKVGQIESLLPDWSVEIGYHRL